MVQVPAKPLTLAEFLQLPETEPPSEYINGQISPILLTDNRYFCKSQNSYCQFQNLLPTSS
jgi:Uma2 family endonuclease